jgi:DNA-directed RNA polymerase subunit RPC12/RpoP
MADVTGYCMKCKKKQKMNDPKSVIMKNKRKATKGECPKCGTKMFKIGG